MLTIMGLFISSLGKQSAGSAATKGCWVAVGVTAAAGGTKGAGEGEGENSAWRRFLDGFRGAGEKM